MAIEAEFLHLATAFEALREVLQSLGLTVIEDRPSRGEVLLVERLGNLVEDLRGLSEEGLEAAQQARRAVGHPLDGYRVRQALGCASERFIALKFQFFNNAVSHETIDALQRFGRQSGGEWLGWSASVVTGLQRCREPLRALDEAVLQAWQELSERLGSGALSVQTTNIAQQIAVPRPERRRPGNAMADTRLEQRT